MNFKNSEYSLALILAGAMTGGSLQAQDTPAQEKSASQFLSPSTQVSTSPENVDENASEETANETDSKTENKTEARTVVRTKRTPRRSPFPLVANTYYDETGALSAENFDIHTVQLVEVPIERLTVKLNQTSDNIWAKGPRPKGNFLAALEYSAISEAEITMTDGQPARVYKASRNTLYPVPPSAPDELTIKSTVYCGRVSTEQSLPQNICLHDIDNNGQFDRIAFARSESVDEHAIGTVMMFPSAQLQDQLAYTAVSPADRTVLDFEMRNCDKDWDRPRYSIARKVSTNQDDDLTAKLLALLSNSQTLSTAELTSLRAAVSQQRRPVLRSSPVCQRGEEIEQFGAITKSTLEKKHILTDLDGLIFSVGPKKAGSAAKLLAAREDGPAMRLEAGALQGADTGLSKLQKQVATSQIFDRPPYMSTGEIHIEEGVLGLGDTLFEVPFEYGYMGELTETARIRTILSSRSVKGGSVLYGFPTEMRRTVTYNGIPQTPFGGSLVGDNRRVTTQLTWCNPVSEEKETDRQTKDGVRLTETVWTATCFSQIGDKHSIIKGQKPAFAVTRMGHTANISTNDGKPPIKRLDRHSFDAPMVLKYSLEEAEKGRLFLRQSVWFGDEEIDSQTVGLFYSPKALFGEEDGPEKLTWETGKGIVTVQYAEGTERAERMFEVTLTKPAEKGASVKVSRGRGSIFGF